MTKRKVPLAPIRVVVASDDAVYAANLEESLTACGMDVLRYPLPTIRPAIERDLLAVDVMLVELESTDACPWQLAQRMRKVAPLVEVVVISANPTLRDALRALRTGVFDVLEYPVSQERLVQTVSDACKRKRQAEARIRQLDGEPDQSCPDSRRFSSGSQEEEGC